jgi:hypothetical protein
MKTICARSFVAVRVALFLVFAFLQARICLGQFENAAVLGTISDPNGALVQQAQVSLLNVDTGVAQTGVTDSKGDYQFLEVHVGNYQVKVDASGFKSAKSDGFHVEPGARQRVDISLQIGDTGQVVEVKSAASLIQTESSDRGEVISNEKIVELPLNGWSTGVPLCETIVITELSYSRGIDLVLAEPFTNEWRLTSALIRKRRWMCAKSNLIHRAALRLIHELRPTY